MTTERERIEEVLGDLAQGVINASGGEWVVVDLGHYADRIRAARLEGEGEPMTDASEWSDREKRLRRAYGHGDDRPEDGEREEPPYPNEDPGSLRAGISQAVGMLSAHLEEHHDADYRPHEVPSEVKALQRIGAHLRGTLLTGQPDSHPADRPSSTEAGEEKPDVGKMASPYGALKRPPIKVPNGTEVFVWGQPNGPVTIVPVGSPSVKIDNVPVHWIDLDDRPDPSPSEGGRDATECRRNRAHRPLGD